MPGDESLRAAFRESLVLFAELPAKQRCSLALFHRKAFFSDPVISIPVKGAARFHRAVSTSDASS